MAKISTINMDSVIKVQPSVVDTSNSATVGLGQEVSFTMAQLLEIIGTPEATDINIAAKVESGLAAGTLQETIEVLSARIYALENP